MTLHPMLAQMLEMGKDAPHVATQTVADARAGMDLRVQALAPFQPDGVATTDLVIDGPGGALPLRLYRPDGATGALPVLVYLHGGGWVVGSIATHDNVCRALALAGPLLVMSVEYRLAPEARSPAQQADALAAINWARANAGEHGGNPARVSVGGDSAGGNLAVLAAIALRDAGAPLAAQLLIYPVADLPDDRYASYAENAGYGLDRAGMEWFWRHWLGDAPVDAASAPIRADLAGVAPAYVITAEYDVLRDEGEALAARLAAAGVATDHVAVPGMIHGFASLTGLLPEATDAVAAAARWVAAR